MGLELSCYVVVVTKLIIIYSLPEAIMAAIKCLAIVVLFLLVTAISAKINDSKATGVSLVVIGANGDLARRKIWPSLRELVRHQGSSFLSSLIIFAGTRDPPEHTKDTLFNYFKSLSCNEDWNISTTQCSQLNNLLMSSISPVQLKNAEDYKTLQQQIESRLIKRGFVEKARIFYLSVPPFAYSVISHYIHNFTRPLSSHTKLRVAIEKPFSSDRSSARDLADSILSHLNDDEVFLVDHYLHKPGVAQILDFRKANPLLDKSAGLIDHIEIISSETIDVRGRTGYYDRYGVIRDMMQNHLTEILTLLTVDLTNATSAPSMHFDLNAAKLAILKSIYSPFLDSAVFGQYSGYQEDLKNDKARDNPVNGSITPTFSIVALHLQSPFWINVPIIMTSGKKLDKRETVAKIVFKKSQRIALQENSQCDEGNEVVFMIQDRSGSSFITTPLDYNYNLPDTESWTQEVVRNKIEGKNCKYLKMMALSRSVPKETYASVLQSLIRGENDLFVPLSNVLESWRIWSPLLLEYEEGKGGKQIIYTRNLLENLLLSLNGSKLTVTINNSEPPLVVNETNSVGFEMDHVNFITGNGTEREVEKVFGHPLYKLSRTSLVREIARDILHTALTSVSKRNSFHLALPGGASPIDLYQSLVFDYKYNFPWMHTSIWQTDERCVPNTSRDSNLFQLSKSLLEYVHVPYANVHPLFPVCYGSESVSSDYKALDYFDYVLLGVGSDGHTASLFPDNVMSSSSNETIQFVNLPPDYPIKVKERVSLSLERLIKSRGIGLIITGKNKCHLARMLESQESSKDELLPFMQLLKKAAPGAVKVWMNRHICE